MESTVNTFRSVYRRGYAPKRIFFMFCLLFAIGATLPSIASAADSSLSQFGITWTFDKKLSTNGAANKYHYGQFANGDYWVVGEPNVIITGISPTSFEGDSIRTQDNDSWVVANGRIVNGSETNPRPTAGWNHGYDSITSSATYKETYNAAREGNNPIDDVNTLELAPNTSLISSISLNHNDADYHPARTVLKTAAVLTVLPSAPAAGSFRPAYVGTDKTIKYNESQLNYDLLGTLDKKTYTNSNNLKMDDWTDAQSSSSERAIVRPWLDYLTGNTGEVIVPDDNARDYPGYRCGQLQVIAMNLNVDWTGSPGFVSNDQYKRDLLVYIVQHGIDTYAVYQEGAATHWKANGGHGVGRKWPILFAGIMLEGDGAHADAAAMADIGFNDYDDPWFSEDAQTFYVNQRNYDAQDKIYTNPTRGWADPDRVCTTNTCRNHCGPDHRDAHHIGYTADDLGMPEWGIRYMYPLWGGYGYVYKCNRYWPTYYRQGQTSANYPGFVLSMHIMGLKDEWDHDAFFDYMDRYIAIEKEIKALIVAEGGSSSYSGYIWDGMNKKIVPVIYNTPGSPGVNVHGDEVDESHNRHYVCSSSFVEQMWDTYRADYGPVWSANPADPNNQAPNADAGQDQTVTTDTMSL